MKQVDYARLTHRLEGAIDEVIGVLQTSSDPAAGKAQVLLIDALRQTEEEIIKEHTNVIRFPSEINGDEPISQNKKA